jgi:hypothetical protein
MSPNKRAYKELMDIKRATDFNIFTKSEYYKTIARKGYTIHIADCTPEFKSAFREYLDAYETMGKADISDIHTGWTNPLGTIIRNIFILPSLFKLQGRYHEFEGKLERLSQE